MNWHACSYHGHRPDPTSLRLSAPAPLCADHHSGDLRSPQHAPKPLPSQIPLRCPGSGAGCRKRHCRRPSHTHPHHARRPPHSHCTWTKTRKWAMSLRSCGRPQRPRLVPPWPQQYTYPESPRLPPGTCLPRFCIPWRTACQPTRPDVSSATQPMAHPALQSRRVPVRCRARMHCTESAQHGPVATAAAAAAAV